MSPKSRTSEMWEYFTYVDKDFAQCNFCSKKVSHRTSISNLKRHLERLHVPITVQQANGDLDEPSEASGSSISVAALPPQSVTEDKNGSNIKQECVLIEMGPQILKNGQVLKSRRVKTIPLIPRRRNQPEDVEDKQTINESLISLNKSILQQANKHKEEEEEDDCELYGKMLAKKLRKLSEYQRLQFMHEIDGMYINWLSDKTQPVSDSSFSEQQQNASSSPIV